MKRVLMLTLGTGSLYGIKSDDQMENQSPEKKKKQLTQEKEKKQLTEEERNEKLQKMIEEGKFGYREAVYSIGASKKEQKSEFVAEPLLDHYNPDIVIVIGTVKSAWAQMYLKFKTKQLAAERGRAEEAAKMYSEIGRKEFPTLKKLSDWEWDCGKDTSGEELKSVQDEINRIFQRIFGEGRTVKIILTRYGLNRQELLENYKILSEMKDFFDEKEEYEVAFDITLSFRSMPIYNLVVFNYLKNIYQYNITIKHIYYGNLETSRENNGKAPIVDLYDLIEVMDLTNGVSEFENTGNAVTLFSLLPDNHSLKEALMRFDWATQLNSYDAIRQSLIDLMKKIENQKKSENKFTDIGHMIEKVIQKKFFGNQKVTVEMLEHILTKEEMQFMICKWYYQQNRYGQAIATALEVLRSMLVPLYLEDHKKEITEETKKDENNRRNAVDRLRLLKADGCTSKSETYDFLMELEDCRTCAKQVRDNFAHNLDRKVSPACEKCQGEKREICDRNIIEQFITKIEELHKQLNECEQEVKEAYNMPITQDQKPKMKSKNPIRVVVTNNSKKNYSFLQTSNTARYDVYVLPEQVCSLLGKSKGAKKDGMILNSLFLCKYIKRYFDDEVNVILDMDMGLKQMLYYSVILPEQGFGSLWVLNGDKTPDRVPELAVQIAYEKRELNSNICRLLDESPVHLE